MTKSTTINKKNLKPHQRLDRQISIPYSNIYELLQKKARETPRKTFLISPGEKDIIYTYQKFITDVNSAAHYLQQLSLKKGDRINLIIPNSAEFILLFFAAFSKGISVVPINPELSISEMLFIIKDSKSKAIFYSDSLREKVHSSKKDISKTVLFQLVHSLPSFEPVKHTTKSIPLIKINVAQHDEAVVIYTSGTTGNPKGVVLTHLNFLADSKAISEWFQFSKQTRTLCILPLFHNNGQVVTLLSPLYAGGSTVIVRGKASFASFWNLIALYKVNWTSVMPSIFSILMSLPYKRKDSTMKGILCGGQVLTNSVRETFEKRFHVHIFEGYGLTETTSFACFNRYPAHKRILGSIGYPLTVNDMMIVDDSGKDQKDGQSGEICIRGLNVANEYYNLPEKNKTAFKNGLFHSGDYGYRNKDGSYYFLTRKDHLIIKGGENIYPAELENILFMHPSVAESAVVGIPDDILGENICAFIKLNDGVPKIKETELIKFCRGKIAQYKIPKKIIIIDYLEDLKEIPKGPTKKVLYRVLKQYYIEKYCEEEGV
jgi:acyl-CoA synthetase (AMP-forming)/AMP-acid ligase II